MAVAPGDGPAQRNLACALQATGDLAAATAFRRALALRPGDIEARFRLAEALEKAGARAEARAEYRTVAAAPAEEFDAALLPLRAEASARAARLSAGE